MKTWINFLFYCLLFEPERIIFNPLFCPFEFLPSIIHIVSFIFFTAFVFYRASQENKLVYTQKQLRLLVLFLFLSIIYCMYFYFSGISFFNFGLKVKLFLWCFYFIVLKQYLAIVDHRKMLKMIGSILSILLFISLPWSLGIHGVYTSSSVSLIKNNQFPYNPNWFACLLCFMFLYFCKEMKRDRNKFLFLSLLAFVLFLFQTKFSFLLACFILPFFVFKKATGVAFFMVIILGLIFSLQCFSIKNNKICDFFNNKKSFEWAVNSYIRSTSCGDFLSERLNLPKLKTQDSYKTKESHNFFITLFKDYNFIEKCIFLTVFFTFFSSSSILFLLYCFTITAPLYFFIAFTFLIKTKN